MFLKKKSQVLLGLCLMLVMSACTQANRQEHVYTVVVTQPKTTISDGGEMSLPGVVKEAQNVKAAFKAAGQLMKVNVKEGDYVRQGQLLATLDDVDYRIGLDAAQAQYDQLKDEVARITKLYDRGSVSANEYEKAVKGLEQVEAQLRAKKNQVEYTKLFSPATGYVDRVNSHKGEMVDAGTTVLTIIDGTDMQVEVNIPLEVYRRREQLGNFKAKVSGAEYPMTLVSVTPKTDGTQMYKMLLGFPKDIDSSLASGANVNVNFVINGNGANIVNELSIPVSAIFYDNSTPCVWVVTDEGKVDKRQLQLASMDNSGEAIVISGLSATDRVVRSGVKHLHQGDSVEILDREVETNVGSQL